MPLLTKTPRILVAGDSMTDVYWWGDVSRISPEAPVPVVQVLREESRPGAAANVAKNCEALGARVVLASAHVARKIRVVGRSQQVVRVDFDQRANREDVARLEDLFYHELLEADAVIFSDYGRGALSNIQELIQAAKLAGKPVFVDPKGHDYKRYSGADVVKPNTTELREMVGGWGSEEQLTAKVKLLMGETQIRAVLLTRGAEGMALFTKEGAYSVPAEAREVYDVTGAGDTAIATFAVAVARGYYFHDATRLANKAAGIVVGHFGTAVATEAEVFSGTLLYDNPE